MVLVGHGGLFGLDFDMRATLNSGNQSNTPRFGSIQEDGIQKRVGHAMDYAGQLSQSRCGRS